MIPIFVELISSDSLIVPTQLKQESLQLLAIIHSLLSSHLAPISTSHTVYPELIINEALLLNHVGDLDPTEKFHSSIFDEADNENLVSWLVRCRDMCDLVGADQCILDPPTFFDRTVSVLGSSNSHIRAAALKIFDHLEEKPCVATLLPRLWNRLHSSFRDGRPEEQYALLRISMTWIYKVIFGASLPPFAWAQLEWEDSLARLTRSADVAPILRNHDKVVEVPVTYALLVSLLTKCDFPHTITAFLTTHPDVDLSALSFETLESHIQRFESGDESLSWTRLTEWFVEAVIGAELFRNEHPSAPPLTFENIRIDSSSTIVITFPSSPDEPSISGSLSSDTSILCQLFLHIHRTLETTNRLILPLDPKHEGVVFAHILVALVEQFVASGDLILPNSSPKDYSQLFAERFRVNFETDPPFSNPFRLHNLAILFPRLILHPDDQNSFTLPPHSFLHGDGVETSEELLDAVKKIKETHSKQVVSLAFDDWTEWVKMMETIEKDATIGRDLSFLQSSCLRTTLLSLQTKHQLIANPLTMNKTTKTDSPPICETDDSSLTSSAISAFTNLTFNLHSTLAHQTSSTHSSFPSSTISTQTSLPSDHWSSDCPTVPSDQLVIHSDSVKRHSREILSVIHHFLTRPSPTSFQWYIRPSFDSESEWDTFHQPRPQFVDQNEKFDISLFDEADDQKVVASLRRCHAVLVATRSTDCIVDVGTFRMFLISGLHSTNFVVQMQCHFIFIESGILLQTVDDPRDSQFQSLHKAFRDGSYWEKMTLLDLWRRWLDKKDRHKQGQMMVESDFDFDGLLNADLSDRFLFDEACDFVRRIITNNTVSMSQPWRLDFLLSFEKRHQMMSRLSSDPSPSSDQKRSTFFLSPLAIILGSILSVFRGCDFPSALTELITTDLDSSNLRASQTIFPAFFLNHTSINPKHRHSFFPMDLMLERYLRSDPDAFFRYWTDVSYCTSRKFLHTSYVGLHSILLRSPTLNLDEQSLDNLIDILFITSLQDTPQANIVNLFGLFPPPRLFDTLLSPPHLVRARIDIWTDFLFVFGDIVHLTAPFGACSSLAKVFKMLAPFDSNPKQTELNRLSEVGEIVVSLLWLSIPIHYDSPLLCHLPSLAGAQRGVLHKPKLPLH
ncbi:hypothetical protein BLNAU_9661 [Blattamonas nauphoetae]|uniref:Uncharacterized protein n=1 Tax=Blattamonas nauphoetae TaxID=2049346 RepID=A0ABQ9XVD2_9EUKA|nr:hypothetical protein BLNAU_9661 [Blattamonas nauphoetae]